MVSEPREAVLAAIAASADPLGAALAIGDAFGPAFIVQAALRFGRRPSVRQARLLVDLGAALAARGAEAEIVPADGPPACSWLRAGLLAARGDRAAAADAAMASVHEEASDLRSFRELFCARELAGGATLHEKARALPHLRLAAREAGDVATLLAIDKLRARLSAAGAIEARRRLRVAVLGSVTLDLLEPAMRAAGLGRGLDLDLFVGGFDQYQQEIIGPDARLDAFAPEAIVLIVDGRSLALADESGDPAAVVARETERLRRLWHRARERWSCLVLQSNFVIPPDDPYGTLSVSLPGGRGRVLRTIDLALWEAAASEPGVHIIDSEQIAGETGKRRWADPAAWYAAKQEPAPAGVPALAHHVAALLQAGSGLSAKCLVLDLDNTLWGGVVGDDGLDGIVLGGSEAGEAYVGFQRYLRSLSARGVALAVCSKNEESTARAPFREHPEMVLREDDLIAFVANWEPKPDNLRRIAHVLNIGTEALVLVDDNPVERELVKRAMPEVGIVELPSDPAGFARAVAETLAFEALTLTSEDRARVASYRGEASRASEAATSSLSVEEFIDFLDMTVEFSEFMERDVPRLHQLVNKTNQFNLTTVRMTEAEVRALIGASDVHTQAVRLRDRFGEHGLIAILIAHQRGPDLVIEQWLMSCRVFGRRLEDVMIAHAARAALAHGAATLVGRYVPTEKNRAFEDLFGRLGFALERALPDGTRLYRADAFSISHRPLPKARVIASAVVPSSA